MLSRHYWRLLAKRSVKGWNQSLRKPEREDKLGAGHEQLGHEALEKGPNALILGHVGHDPHTALGVLKVAVLNTRLDDIEGRRHDERGRGTGNGGDKVLEPRRLVVILQVEEVFLGKGRATKEL